jgi:hypothetical protein
MRALPKIPEPFGPDPRSIVESLFLLQPGDACPASSVYVSACDCRATVALATGEECPPCPRCHRAVEWDFVRVAEGLPPAGRASA